MKFLDWWWCTKNNICAIHLTQRSWKGECWKCREEQQRLQDTLNTLKKDEMNKNLERLREKYGRNHHTENDD